MSGTQYIFGLESSCDETACALVDERGFARVNAVASQIELHARFGGIVPEEASRRHIEAFLPMIESTLEGAGVNWDQIEGIAVTRGPGLIGCLLIGVETAKALAWRYRKPLYGVHHLQGHLHAPFLHPGIPGASHLMIQEGRARQVLPFQEAAVETPPGVEFMQPDFPHTGLIVSGGHTSLVSVTAPGRCRTLASTRDDAVGEAYDKVARILGLGFPGGPVIDRRAAEGAAGAFAFTPPMKRRDAPDFSFSGLKSAVARKVEELKRERGGGNGADAPLPDGIINGLCHGFQNAAIEALLSKSLEAARSLGARDLLVVGGVASNRGLRRAAQAAAGRGLRVWFPHFSLCTDNAAMIAGLAWRMKPLARDEALELNPEASLPMEA